MKSTLTVAFTGKSPVLYASFLPEITLDEEYVCAFLDLYITSNNEKKLELKSQSVRINCDIISNSYINGKQSHVIHQFVRSISLDKNKPFSEYPKHLNYFPVKTKNLRSIQISIINQQGEVLNFTGCDIICRINIKREDIARKST